ncbi:hypothetical protein REDROCK_36 [Mycobacterium phage RedRock]|uniref:Uncharacterized protein n=1 Tax=Mycobacterium phage RedRock TaxID=711470 RepID=D3JZ98_9CAUD|nr:hypothetical protein REDROCK_36 [Mycobacterium phage RedRock]ADB93729.1 hypothetical protein REDROCK_36 [Mycobacterium phage RedRock]
MKRIDSMSSREREAIIHDLEIEHRAAIVAAAKTKREIRSLVASLESQENRIREIETGIALLR